jgi:hypothetical protein
MRTRHGSAKVNIQDLMRPRRDRPGQYRASQFRASLLEGAHDTSKLGTRQCPLDIHKGPSKAESLDRADTGDKLSGESGEFSPPTGLNPFASPRH